MNAFIDTMMNVVEEVTKQKNQADKLLQLLKDGFDRCNICDKHIRTLSHLESFRLALNGTSKTNTLFDRLVQFIQEDTRKERGFTNNGNIFVTLSQSALISFDLVRLIDAPNEEEILSFFESHESMISIELFHQNESMQFDTLYQPLLEDNDILIEQTSHKMLNRSQVEYNRLTVCFEQCIHALDSQCPRKVVRSLTTLAISTIIGWCKLKEKDDQNILNVLRYIFDEQNFMLHGNQSSQLPFVLCTVDHNLMKLENHFGITFRAEMMTPYDIRSKFQEHDLDIKCMFSQKFSIVVSNNGETFAFEDCEDFSESESQQKLLHKKRMIDLDPPELMLLFERKRTNTECVEPSSNASKQSLETLIQTINQTSEHRDTLVLGWHVGLESVKTTNWLSNAYPAIIQFHSLTPREVIKSISCSSRHLLALTHLGSVYSCGEGSDGQLGLNSQRSETSLEHISWFMTSNDQRIIILSVAAGADESSSHSAAIDESGRLYTWGSALLCGHGFVKQPHILCPRLVDSLENFKVTSVSCGNGFSLAIGFDRNESSADSNHKPDIPFVFSWGKISHGRLGHGKPKQDYEAKRKPLYENYPTKIAHLIGECIVQISAGNAHALALTRSGDVFAWGSNEYGQCAAFSLDFENPADYFYQRKFHFFERNEMRESNYELMDVWIPRKIHLMGPKQGKPVSKICAGSIQSACISNGSLYTWGGGGLGILGHEKDKSETSDFSKDYIGRNILKLAGHLIVPSWTQPRRVLGLDRTEVVDVDLGFGHGMVLTKDDELFMLGKCSANVSSIAMSPTLNEFQLIRGKAISKICCGGPYSFCISSGDLSAAQLGTNLYNETLDNRFQSDKNSFDCNIVICGKRIPCHKIILALRSSILNNLLRVTSKSQLNSVPVIDLFLSNEKYETVKDLIAFIYKDSVADLNTRSLSSTLSLCKTAARFKVSGLVKKCKEILKDDFGYFYSSERAEENDTTFATDLFNALTDTSFFDMKIISSDDRILTAHKCILRSRGIHFEIFFHTISSEFDSAISVPFSSGSLHRILFYTYTYRLKDECSQCELIEDISNAYIINLTSMVKLCESALNISSENAIQIFSLSLKIESASLRLRSMHVIVKSLAQQENLDQLFLNPIPSKVMDELFIMIKDHVGISSIISRERRDDAIKLLQRERRYEKEMNDQISSNSSEGFTVSKVVALFLAIFVAVYTILIRYRLWITGPIVPIMNAITIILILVYLTLSIM